MHGTILADVHIGCREVRTFGRDLGIAVELFLKQLPQLLNTVREITCKNYFQHLARSQLELLYLWFDSPLSLCSLLLV